MDKQDRVEHLADASDAFRGGSGQIRPGRQVVRQGCGNLFAENGQPLADMEIAVGRPQRRQDHRSLGQRVLQIPLGPGLEVVGKGNPLVRGPQVTEVEVPQHAVNSGRQEPLFAAEVTEQGHLVDAGGLGDGPRGQRHEPRPRQQVPGRCQNALLGRLVFHRLHLMTVRMQASIACMIESPVHAVKGFAGGVGAKKGTTRVGGRRSRERLSAHGRHSYNGS
jgi:hypothetical protein